METGINVLYVDDEPGLLEIARLFLEEIGKFKVFTSLSAQDALESSKILSYDAIISDYQMPGMDGITFLKEVRHRYGDIPFILFTGRGREEVVIEAINNGADFYLQKGGDPTAQFAELAHKIRQAVARKQAELSRVKAEIDLKESEEKYRSLIDLVPLAVLVHRQGKIVYANPECVRLSGARRAEELIGREMLALIHPDDRPAALENFRQARAGAVIPLTETRLFTIDGQPFTVEAAGKQIIFEGIPSVIVVYRDITDRKKGEDELRAAYEQLTAAEEELRGQYEELARGEQLVRESQVRLRTFMDSATDSYSIWDADLNLVDLNQVALSMLPPGLQKDDIIGRNLSEFVSGSGEWRDYNRYLDVIKTGVPFTGTEKTPDPQFGRHWLNVKCFRVGDGLGIVTSDITREKEAEEKLREAYEQLTAAEEELRGQYEELARGEQLVRESQVRLRTFMDSATDAFTIWDADLNLVDLNRVALSYLPARTRKEDITGKNFADLMAGSREWGEYDRYLDVIKTGVPFTGTEMIPDPQYGRQWVDIKSFRVGDGLGIVTSDITREKEAEEKLRAAYEQLTASEEELRGQYEELALAQARILESQQQLTEIAGTVPGVVCQFCTLPDGSMGAGFVSSRAREVFGISNTTEGFVERFTSQVDFRDRDAFRHAIHEAASSDSPWNFEGRFIRPDGERVWFEGIFRPVKKGSGFVHNGVLLDITGRKMAEEGRRESEEKFRTVFEKTHDAFMIFSDGVCTDCNQSALDLFGYGSREEIRGLTPWDLSPPVQPDGRDAEPAAGHHLRTAAELGSNQFVWTHKKKDGSTFTADVLLSSWELAGKQVIFSSIRDITERRRMEEELLLLKLSVDKAFDEVFWLDFTGSILYVNDAACKITGYTPEEFRAMKIFELDPDYKPDVWERSVADLRKQKKQFFTTRHRCRDGRIIDVEIAAVYVNKDGREYSFAFVRDITRRKETERSLKESEERSRKILEQVPLPLALVRDDGVLTFVNDRFVRVFGYTRKDIPTLESWWQQAYPDPAYRKEVIRTWDEAVRRAAEEHRDIRPAEYRVTCKDREERIIEISGIVLPDGFLATFIDNTERKRMDEALFGSRQMLQAVLDSIPQRVFWKDKNSVFLGCNMPLARDAGFSDPAKIVGKTDYDHASRATAELYRADDRRVMETGQPRTNYEEPQIRPDGSQAWLRTSKVPLRSQDGTIIGVMGTYEDITGQKQAQEKLKESEERYRSLIDTSFDGIAIHQDGNIVFANPTAARLLGYEDPSSLLSKTVFDIIHPDDREWIAARMKESPGKPLDLVHEKFLRADGTYLHVDVATTPCTWKGKPAVYVTFRDITEQVKTEEALRQRTEELDRFFTASLDLFCIATNDGYFRRLNPEWEKTLGYTLAELEGRRFLDFVHPDDLPATRAAVTDLSHQKQVLDFTNRYRHKDGTYRWIEWRSFPSGDRIFAAARDITGRKQIEEALRGSEERLRLFIAHAPAALAMLDTEMRYIVTSRRWMADYHLGDRDLAGLSHYEIFPELTEEIRGVLRRGLAGEISSANEDKFERQDGSVQWLAWEVRPWYTAGHDIGGVIIFSEDITQRKKAEEALRESEARLASILHSSPVLQFVIGSDHRILSWNKALEEYSGIKAAEVIGTDQQWRAFYQHRRPVLADLLVDDNTDGLFKWYAGKLQPSRYVDGAYEATDFFPSMGASGTWLAFTAAPIRDADGAITGAVETLEDVTERKRAEQALRESEEKYRHILENMQDAYIRVDENGIITMVNLSAVRMYGYGSVEEMTGIPVASLYSGAEQQRGDLLRKLTEAGGVTDFYGEARRKDGTTLWTSVNAQYLTDREGRIRGTEGIIRDITERKTMERAVREANRKLALLSSITRHDIQNQLLTLNGFIALLKRKTPQDPDDDYFPRIMAASNNIQKMIQFTKEYEQIGMHAPVWQNLHTLVDSAGRDAVMGQITLKNDIPPAAEVFADPLIAKVIFNLVDNAVRHGGKITTVRFLLEERDHDCIVVCEDDGNGVPADEKEKIFDLGFGKNTGFGLSISREILEITGITIKESGEPGRGARFEIAVPDGHFRSVQ